MTDVPDEVQKNVQYMHKAVVAIMNKTDGKRGISGTIECPKCQGTLNFSIAPNGHPHGKCQTEGCLQWLA